MILAFVSLIMTWKHLTMMSVIVAKLMQKQTYAQSWNRLLFRDKLKFFNLWTVVSITANIFQMFGAVISFCNIVDAGLSLVIGFGCFFAWINIIRYMVEKSESYVAIRSLQYSSEILIPYMAGVVPIYMAFVFLGMSLFWSSGSFTNVTESMATTFALMQADTFFGTMSALEQVNNFLGMLYTVAFTLFFICVVNNIFIAIITESYKVIKTHSHTHEIDESKGIEQEDPSSPLLPGSSPSSPKGVGIQTPTQGSLRRLSYRKSKKEESLNMFKHLVTGIKTLKQTPLDDAVHLGKTLYIQIEDILREIQVIKNERQSPQVDQRVKVFIEEQLPSMLEFFKATNKR
mmetsp:Transcript_27645/g.49915  ORF Transcript_27645/g.49915 Transcript_27645/m.49915 type:complete len:345 (-) Transcript_27645:20-1054(-)